MRMRVGLGLLGLGLLLAGCGGASDTGSTVDAGTSETEAGASEASVATDAPPVDQDAGAWCAWLCNDDAGAAVWCTGPCGGSEPEPEPEPPSGSMCAAEPDSHRTVCVIYTTVEKSQQLYCAAVPDGGSISCELASDGCWDCVDQ